MVVRQQSIHGLPSFVRALFRAAEKSGPAGAKLVEALTGAMEAECVQCDLHVAGDDLRALSAPPDQGASAKVIRLLQGYCARNGCDSYHYHLVLSDHPDIDWHKLIALAESSPNQPEPEFEPEVEVEPEPEPEALGPVISWTTYRRWASWAGLGLVGIFLLLLMRQLYMGGTIPFLREPEHFQVDAFETDLRSPR